MARLTNTNDLEMLQEIINHTFLPKMLPSTTNPSELLKLNNCLLSRMSKHLNSAAENAITKTKKLFSTWEKLQHNTDDLDLRHNLPHDHDLRHDLPHDHDLRHDLPHDHDLRHDLRHVISNMRSDELTALYVAEQNAALILSKNDKSEITISTFECSCRSDQVMSSNSLLVEYPTKSVKIVNSELLNSEDFYQFLQFFAHHPAEIAIPKTIKAGRSYNETRDVPNPMLIQEFVVAILCDSNSSTDKSFPRVRKKVRDDIILSQGTLPFRRSGCWIAIKVLLQLSLQRENTALRALFQYKCIMIDFLLNILKNFHSASTFQWDLKMQMMAKIARRLEKLRQDSKNTKIHKYWAELLDLQGRVNDSLREIRLAMDLEWTEASSVPGASFHEISTEEIQGDVKHCVSELKEQLASRLQIQQESQNSGDPKIPDFPTCPERLESSKFPIMANFFKNKDYVTDFELCEIGNWVKNSLHSFAKPENCESIKELAFQYTVKAKTQYMNDPIAYGKFGLVMMKFIQILDQIAVNVHPLLAEHRSGMNLSFVQKLLLRQMADMEWAKELEDFFEKRDQRKTYPSLIEETNPSERSFAVRFASGSKEMQKLLKQIQADSEQKILEKKTEVIRTRTECNKLRSTINTLQHENYWDSYYQRNVHRSNLCEKCRLERDLESRLKSVRPYERPLPTEISNQYAVIFELQIPVEISCLRDVLLLFSKSLSMKNMENTEKYMHHWLSYPALSNYHTNSQINHKMGLVSTTELSAETHNARGFSVDEQEDNFILPNGLNQIYSPCDMSLLRPKIEEMCELKISERELAYTGMQWMVPGTQHTSNQVLAKQSLCPTALTLAEYIQFGSLRAGHLLQYRNLVVSLTSGKLSLKSEAVLALLCQAIWQAGPNTNGSPVRDSHFDLTEEPFSIELLQIIAKLVESHKLNWSHPNTMISLVVITSRILELTSSDIVKTRAVQILRQCREIGLDWITATEKLLQEVKEDSQNGLKHKTVCAALLVTMTFAGGREFIASLLSGPEDLLAWLCGISTLQNELLWNIEEKSLTLGISQIQRNLLRVTIQAAFDLEPQMQEIIRMSPSVLTKYSKIRWHSGLGDEWPSESQPNKYRNIFRCMTAKSIDNSQHIVDIDILFGKFLVDGCPVGKLPENITDNPDFVRVFGSVEFQVQPNKSGSSVIYTTTTLYNNCTYTFQQLGNTLLVKEFKNTAGNLQVLDLIPHHALQLQLPTAFVESYSHWASSNKDVIFRQKKFQDFETFHQLDLSRGIITERSARHLLDMNSPTVNQLTNIIARIEKRKYIHAWVQVQGQVSLNVELTHIGLTFDTSSPFRELISREFPGMMVDTDQGIGTLVGLQNILVLRNSLENSIRKVIVPHGKIVIANGGPHQTVSIDLENLQNPKFFVYEIDVRMRKLSAGRNETAWLYLAALHAATASPLEDSLTGVTGTEMAFQILQSSRVWSSFPYRASSHQILSDIKNLFTPNRHFYPTHLKVLQKIQWPVGLPSTAVHEGFSLIVEKLLQDSMRLAVLFNSDVGTTKVAQAREFNGELNTRHYFRHTLYVNELAKLSSDFQEYPEPLPKVYATEQLVAARAEENLRIFSQLCHSCGCQYTANLRGHISNLLLESNPLAGLTQFPNIEERFPRASWFHTNSAMTNTRNNFLDLYSFACEVYNGGGDFRHKWHLLLSAMLFQGVQIEFVKILQIVAVHGFSFATLSPPSIKYYENPKACFNESEVRNLVVQKSCPNILYTTYEAKQNAEAEFRRIASSQEDSIGNFIKTQWNITPRTQISIYEAGRIDKIEIDKTQENINKRLSMWYDALQLRIFLEKFEIILTENLGHESLEFGISVLEPLPKVGNSVRAYQNSNTLVSLIENTSMEADDEAKSVYENTEPYEAGYFSDIQGFESHRQLFATKSEVLWTLLAAELTAGEEKVSLNAGGLLPRLVPQTMMPLLMATASSKLENFQNRLGAICVFWTFEQKMIRCIQYLKTSESMKLALDREKETQGPRSWKPKEYPGWLLLELELNMMIRPIQFKVAGEMMNPSGRKNIVLQLNMGEGKTSLILPMLAIVLANGSQLCRITVIKSIFETNFNALRHTLGGLLNRRVFCIPCRRDIQFTPDIADSILRIYKESCSNQSLMVTLPEERLSFQLKCYETAGRNSELADKLIQIKNWLDANTRDILDESDDVLDVKYQLIYAMGSQEHVDGGDLRWILCQRLLKCLPKHFRDIQLSYGDTALVFESSENPSQFPTCRLSQMDIGPVLIEKLVEDFLQGKIIEFVSLNSSDKALIKKFLTDNTIAKEEVIQVLEMFIDDKRNTDILLIMAGYLKFGILESALRKRYRVNYGVNTKVGKRLMAVPFKAKDVATERTEFGHPDMAILFTLLSYYYSGITDDQILQCFDILTKSKDLNPVVEYASWIVGIPAEKLDSSILKFEGINLDDVEQRTKFLFPILRKSMNIIDFWLSRAVFPKECKQFPGKMTTTAWDLCSESKAKLTTGFSGTNDTQDLLPLNICQADLDELKETNANLKKILLDPINDNYVPLPNGYGAKDILRELQKLQIRVLLDCGALVLELSNEECARAWLEIDSTLDAIVYFNKKNILTVLDRREEETDFELSPYRDQLHKCGIYLDDEHTRGTDMKFPSGYKACVTLGTGLTRDKMVQACMRMRMLANKEHSVIFFASHDVDSKIKALSTSEKMEHKNLSIQDGTHKKLKREFGSRDVLQWVKANSNAHAQDGLVYWSISGQNYFRKRIAEMKFNSSVSDFSNLGLNCIEAETLKLNQMYGNAREIQLLQKLVPIWLKTLEAELNYPEGHEYLEQGQNAIVGRIERLIPEKTFYCQLLEEEQERELELELEIENERELPPGKTPLKHSCIIFEAYKRGKILSEDEELQNIKHAFFETSLVGLLQEDHCWGDLVFVSPDFIRTVELFGTELRTSFLRPITWVVKMELADQLLIISPYEANCLISDFRNGIYKCSIHLYTPRHFSKQANLVDNYSLSLPLRPIAFKTCWEKMLPALELASGNLYFTTESECQYFQNLLAIIPKPWNEEEETAFEEGLIDKTNGFVKCENRTKFPNGINKRAFSSNPQKLVLEILQIRHEALVPLDSDVVKLVLNGVKFENSFY